MSDMVNSPSHYIGGTGRPECIELINDIICGHKGVSAFCIGQVKYLYRAGKKSDSSMSMDEKSLEDIKKFKWYISYLIKEYKNIGWKYFDDFIRIGKTIPTPRQHFIANEFSTGKEDVVCDIIYDIVLKLTHIESVNDYDLIDKMIDNLISVMRGKENYATK